MKDIDHTENAEKKSKLKFIQFLVLLILILFPTFYIIGPSQKIDYASIYNSTYALAQTKPSSSDKSGIKNEEDYQGISIFEFIEKISGKRDFDLIISLTFDIINNNNQRINFTARFEMKIVNFEDFTFHIFKPQILEDVIINYNLVTRKIHYIYRDNKVSENFKMELNQTSSLVQSITDFLSSPLFDVTQSKDTVIFKPKNFQILSRFGVQPIIVHLKIKNNIPESIEIRNDKTNEKITLAFEKFNIIG